MRPSHPILVLCLGIAGYSILHSGQAAADCSAVLTPYTASYQVFKDNKEVGVMDVSLKESGGAYSYSMLTRGTKGMASFVNLAIDQVSDFTMGTELPIPHSYRQTQKTSLWKKTEWVDFDWTDMTASGEKNKKEFDRKLAAGMQDKSTLYLASALAVCGGNPEFEMNVVSGPEPRNYIFNLQQAETLDHPRSPENPGPGQGDRYLACAIPALCSGKDQLQKREGTDRHESAGILTRGKPGSHQLICRYP